MKNEMSTKFPVTIARKKILAVVLCGIMALSLGACGSKDNGGSAKTDDGSAKKEASGGETTIGRLVTFYQLISRGISA